MDKNSDFNKKPLVSIVVPVYNSARFLRKCLDSVLGQTYKNIEVICVNDGSKDDSFAILTEYANKDKRMRVFSKANEGRGAASARNMGMNCATGEYIQFLDSDDFFESDMIEKMLYRAMKTGAEVVICRGQTYDDRTKKKSRMPHPDLHYAPHQDSFSWKECSEYICEIADYYAWNKFIKRSLLIENDLRFTPIPISDDQDISMIAPIVASKVAVIDEAFINYRIGTGCSQCDTQTKHPEAAYEGVYSVVKRFHELNVWESVKQSYLNVSIRLMREYFDRMNEYKKVEMLYNKYRNEIFPLLDAMNIEDGYFHDYRVEEWYKLIMHNSLSEILFMAVRASGGTMTTAPIRFQFPYDDVDENSRIVLVGKGIAGRFWLSQILLSNHCEVVAWVDSKDEISDSLEYDKVVFAY